MKTKKIVLAIIATMSMLSIIVHCTEGKKSGFTMTVSAAKMKSIELENSCLVVSNPYENEFNIITCVNYAIEWYDKRNSTYKANEWAKSNCASFVSECLNAGGIYISEAYRECDSFEIADKLCVGGYKYSNTEWSLASKQFSYLTTTMGYDYEKASDSTIHIGDVVYYDWQSDKDKDINHAAICVGIDDDGNPVIAEHTNDNIRVWDKTVHSKIESAYVVHTTNTKGLKDVTSMYYDENVLLNAIKKENSGFLSSGSIYYVSNDMHYFSVCKNECFDYANLKNKLEPQLTFPISFKSNENNYLSAYVSKKDAPIQSTSNNDTWEAMRIYRRGNNEYIQSMQNGFFIQIQDDGKAYANGKLPSTWETFDVK